MDRFLFLDFDGVLNSDAHQRRLREQKLPWHDGYGPLFDPEAVRNLARILQEVPDVRIVICSTWKDTLGIADLKMMWTERNLPGEVYSTTVSLLHDQLIFEDLSDPAAFAKMEGECKGREILSWLVSYEEMDAPYVIIDDAVGFPPELQPYHVRTDPDAGLTSFDADKAIQILKDMFSMYTEHGYLRARKRQERIAENLSSSNPTEMQINAFLRREERLQAYEFVNCKTGKDAILTVEIDELLLFKVCMKARLAKMAVNDYIEEKIDKAVDQ